MQNKAGPFRVHETSLQRVVMGGQMEQLLHHGLGRGETEGRGAGTTREDFEELTVLGGRVWSWK